MAHLGAGQLDDTFTPRSHFRVPAATTEGLAYAPTMSSSVLDSATTYVYQPLPSNRHVRLLEIVNFTCSITPLPEKQPTEHHAGTTVSFKIFII